MINQTFKRLAVATLANTLILCSLTHVALAAGDDDKGQTSEPPRVTMAEKKLSFWDLPYLNNAFVDANPLNNKDGIAVGELDENSNRAKALAQLAQNMMDKDSAAFDSLLISYQNQLVFESYYRRGRIDLPHFQASVTKAHIALGIGRAIQLGYLTMDDLKKPVVNLIKGIDRNTIAEGTEHITLEQAMSMRSGLRLNDEQLKLISTNAKAGKGVNTTQAFMQHSEVISSESHTFRYQDTDPRLTMQVLDSVVPGTGKDFIKNELLAKMGISDYRWTYDVNDAYVPDSGSSMTSRDMLKLGQLVINNGQWHGEQLIAKAFISAAASGKTKPTEEWIPDNFRYDYFWYRTALTVGDKQYTAKLAWGGGEQYILTIAELDLVVVVTAHARESNTMQMMAEVILPAFIK